MSKTTSYQPALVLDQEDALREVVRALGGAKAAGSRLRPEMDPDAAARWLHDCISPDRAQKLDLAQVVTLARWGREVGCHALMDYVAAAAGYSRPEPLTPQDEAAELQRQFIQAVRELQVIQARIGIRAVGT
jgi:hypothetical protein